MYKMINNQWVDVPEQEIPPQQLIGICSVCSIEKPVCLVVSFSKLKIGIGEKSESEIKERKYFCDAHLPIPL